MAKYRCTVCGYTTERTVEPERCNYCSKLGSMEEEESADELIDDA